MKKNIFALSVTALLFTSIAIVSCKKDVAPDPTPKAAVVATNSFSEEFDNVGDIAAKGWLIKNNSDPAGASAWRQGRYENNLGGNKAGKVIGMPAYSASQTPYDFISADATSVNDRGNINCWLISPQTTVKNGDVLSFYTRAMDDSDWNNFAKDNMQVRANFVDGSSDCGVNATDFGKFTRLLLEMNPTYANNAATAAPLGYPQVWTLKTIVIAGLAAPTKARFAFRFLATDGGLSGTVGTSLIGIDKLEFKSN